MNYVDSRTMPLCISCGDELTESEDLDLSGVACNSCFSESEAKASTARQAEAESNFRWDSLDWFKRSEYERSPFMMRNHFADYLRSR